MGTAAHPANEPSSTEKRIRLAALLTCLGLIILLLTLVRIHPLAFVAFAVIACPLTLAGILLFLYSIVSHAHEPRKP
jgi:archaellum biogenesis protein FlaJ (TadC family)